jgi:nitrate/nitrite transport system ATP-binding protein
VAAHLKIDHVEKVFERGSLEAPVLRDITVWIDKGEYVSIIGHSGCGKSTLLNIVAGLLDLTSGAVLLEDKEVNAPGPDRAVVFQNHSLLPWLTVYDNVRLAVDKVFADVRSRKERHAWTMHNLELVQMAHARDKRPMEISGGMKQRVGIARALAMEPKVLLLDEPFGALDALTRAHLQDSVMAIHQQLENTVLMITHDVDEAVLLSDRIVMMTNGPAATIGEILKVTLPRPRRRLELVGNPTYIQARAAVLQFLYARHQAPTLAGCGAGQWLRWPGQAWDANGRSRAVGMAGLKLVEDQTGRRRAG